MKQLKEISHQQKGIAAILMIVLLGLSLTAIMLGSAHYLRTSQEQHTTLHSQTVAQARVWTAAEALRLYLEAVAIEEDWDEFTSSLVMPHLVNIGLEDINAQIIALDDTSNPIKMTTRLIAKAAKGSRAESTSILEVVYEISLSNTTQSSWPKTGLRINTDFTYSGGDLHILDGDAMADFAVSGDLKVSDGSTAATSGCVKGNIDYSGGGIAEGARLASEGIISIYNMSAPKNINLWAKTINISQGGGTYSSITAGAFEGEVLSDGSSIGRVITGGHLQGGKIIPRNVGTAFIELNDGTQYHLRLDAISIDGTEISKNNAGKRLTGDGALPEVFTFSHRGTHGGDIKLSDSKVYEELWGNSLSLTGWSYDISEIKMHDSLETNPARIEYIKAGGDWEVKSYDQPTLTNGGMIGGDYIGRNQPVNLQTGVGALLASPGLPGTPVCDVTVGQVDVEKYKENANYIFYFKNSNPMLDVRNVKLTSTGELINKTFDLKSDDIRYLYGEPFFQCGWWENHCFRGKGKSATTPSAGWRLTGINSLPPGVIWFDGDVSLDGMTSNSSAFYNTILATGNLNLDSGGGHKTLRAPNFSEPEQSCNGRFYPANLCDMSVYPPVFVNDGGRKGLALANSSIIVEGFMSANGWSIHGNIELGDTLETKGAKVMVYGGLTIGGNIPSYSLKEVIIGDGGLWLDFSSVTQDQAYQPDDKEDSGNSIDNRVSTLWSRYL